jgi:hypothetical protein
MKILKILMISLFLLVCSLADEPAPQPCITDGTDPIITFMKDSTTGKVTINKLVVCTVALARLTWKPIVPTDKFTVDFQGTNPFGNVHGAHFDQTDSQGVIGGCQDNSMDYDATYGGCKYNYLATYNGQTIDPKVVIICGGGPGPTSPSSQNPPSRIR